MVQPGRDAVAPRPRLAFPRRGEVYLVSFDPTLGAEIRKTRPALVIQNDFANRWSPITIVAAISSRSDEPTYPTDVRVDPPEGSLRAASIVLLNHLRSIDRRRLVRRLGRLRPETIKRVDRALQISLGLAGL
jgi:mRNA interferase MazF